MATNNATVNTKFDQRSQLIYGLDTQLVFWQPDTRHPLTLFDCLGPKSESCMAADFSDEHSSQSCESTNKSRFTYRDLRQLGQYSVESPLRVIVLIDFDCFYAQCERVRLGLPEGRPLGVQQFNHVIATNYEARAAGLKKVVTTVEARRLCPEIVLQHVPTWREGDDTWRYRDDATDHMREDKSSLDYYRLQSRRAIAIVKDKLPEGSLQRVEKASIDEIFLDLSAHVHATLLERYPDLLAHVDQPLDSQLPQPWTELLDWADDKLIEANVTDVPDTIDWDEVALNIGAEIVRMLRKEIYNTLHYTCSAGVARNKVVAKLAAGHNKPNKQTIVRNSTIEPFLTGYKYTKLRGLGGKLGQQVNKAFSTEQLSDLLPISVKDMQKKLGTESGSWLYRVIRGIEYSEVTPRTQIKSMGSAKTFDPGIQTMEQAEKWLRIFAADILGRIEEQEGRRPKTMAVQHHANGRFGPTRRKQAPIPLGLKLDIPSLTKLFRDALIEITSDKDAWPCWILTVGVSDFFDTEQSSHSISSLFAMQKPRKGVFDYKAPESKLIGYDETRIKPKKRTIDDFEGFGGSSSTSSTSSKHYHYVSDQLQAGAKKQRSDDGEDAVRPYVPPLDGVEDDGYRCPTCLVLVSADEVLEHLDWHVAMDLQQQG